MDDEPVLPDYDGGCLSNVVGACLGEIEDPWVPAPLIGADQVVLLTIDGLGWEQLVHRAALAPTLASMTGGPVTTVAPSTTATALTSLATGVPPGEHGVVGYRIAVESDILNVLRWSGRRGDARQTIIPGTFQQHPAFGGERPPAVTRAEFSTSGFTDAHLQGVRFVGYRTLATLVTEVRRLAGAGEPFVYAYYEGLDKVSHEYGLGDCYDTELRWCDHLVAELLDCLPPGVTLAVTADHGQVDVGSRQVELGDDLRPHLAMQSGEGRFRWLHARPGRTRQLLEATEAAHGHHAWVRSVEQTVDEGWFGPKVTDVARQRLGDVALVARDPIAFLDLEDTGPYVLIGRHGSLTSAEMLVPFVAQTT